MWRPVLIEPRPSGKRVRATTTRPPGRAVAPTMPSPLRRTRHHRFVVHPRSVCAGATARSTAAGSGVLERWRLRPGGECAPLQARASRLAALSPPARPTGADEIAAAPSDHEPNHARSGHRRPCALWVRNGSPQGALYPALLHSGIRIGDSPHTPKGDSRPEGTPFSTIPGSFTVVVMLF